MAMKQGLALLLICLIFHPTAVPNHLDRHYQSNGEDLRKGAASEPSRPARTTQTANGNQEAPKWYSPVWAEWGLVGVGLLTLIAVWKQARGTRRAADKTAESVKEIRDQTRVLKRQTRSIHHQAVQVRKQTDIFRESADATRRAAEAAADNVKAFVDSEKAWLKADKIGILPPRDTAEPRSTYWISVPIKNFGRTVAHVIDGAVYVRAYSRLPDTPDCQDHPPFKPVIVPGESCPLWTGIEPEAMDIVRKERGPKLLYLYGFVKYRDIGDNERELWFCYFYHVPNAYHPDPEGFYPCRNAPDAYTKCT